MPLFVRDLSLKLLIPPPPRPLHFFYRYFRNSNGVHVDQSGRYWLVWHMGPYLDRWQSPSSIRRLANRNSSWCGTDPPSHNFDWPLLANRLPPRCLDYFLLGSRRWLASNHFTARHLFPRTTPEHYHGHVHQLLPDNISKRLENEVCPLRRIVRLLQSWIAS